jgi:hypothetical protein
VTGSTADISTIAKYIWYQWIYFKDEVTSFPEDQSILGKYLGPSDDVGPAMVAKLLKKNGQVVERSTYRGLTDVKEGQREEIQARDDFDSVIAIKLGDKMRVEDYKDNPDIKTPHFAAYLDEETGDSPRMPDADNYDVDSYDQYIDAEVLLP